MATDKRTKRALANVQDYKDTFNTEAGQKVLWDLMKANGMMADNFCEGDPYSTAYNEGRRGVILKILEKLNTNPKVLKEKIEKGMKDDENWLGSYDEDESD